MLGFVNVYKPRGVTSFKVVGQLKKIYGEKRVGHLGTLDPMAEGVLPVAIGKATKFFDYFLKKDKEYIGDFIAGYETDSLDADGEIVNENGFVPSIEDVQKSCQNFIGKVQQTPPKFSAIKINGQRAYKLAREGKEFEIKPKEVEIYGLTAERGLGDNLYRFKVWCSAGTYIRSLGSDVLKGAGALATMVKLVRTRSGPFKIDDARRIDEIEKDPQRFLIRVSDVLSSIKRIDLTEEEFFKIKNGVVFATDEKDSDYLAYYRDRIVGLTEVEDGKLRCKINLIEEIYE